MSDRVNLVDAGIEPTLVLQVGLAQTHEHVHGLIEASLNHGADLAVVARSLVEWTRQESQQAVELRNLVLKSLVADGMPVAEAARKVGVSRQMARRVLGEVDKETVEGISDALRRLRGAALYSWWARLDPDVKTALAEAANVRD